jgi:signal peptidase I
MRITVVAFATAAFLAAALALVSFLPAQFGGHVTYLRVNGTSMLPTFHTDDVVLVKPADRYVVGDVVAYHNPDLGVVIHRIIERDGDRFVIRGDNNDFDDLYHPLPQDVIGKRWFYIPSAGHLADTLKPPVGSSLVSGLAFGSVMIPAVGKRRGKKARGKSPGASSGGSGPIGPLSPLQMVTVTLAGGALVLAIAATAIAFSRPTTHQLPVDAKYEQQGKFSYGGSGPATAYSGGEIQPGDPIFLKLVNNVNFQFAYHVIGADHVQGDASLALIISQTNGWQKTFDLSPDHAFSGDTLLLSAKVDLNTIRQAIADVEASTGVHYDTYSVRLSPQVKMSGAVGDAAISETFSPELPLRWDSNQLQVNSGAGSVKDPFTASSVGATTQRATGAARFSFVLVSIPISALRLLSLLGIAGALIALGVVGVQVRRARTLDEAERIVRQYGSLLLEATAAPLQPGVPQFSVKRFRDLVALAEPDCLRIFHEHEDDSLEHRYIVMRSEAAYLYTYTIVRPAVPGWRAALPIAPSVAQDFLIQPKSARLPRKSIAGVLILLFVGAALSLRAGVASAGDLLVASTPVARATPVTSAAVPATSTLTQGGGNSPNGNPTSAVH